MTALTFCAAEEAVEEQGPLPLATSLYDTPVFSDEDVPKEAGCWEANTSVLCPILIEQAGTLMHQGEEIGFEDLQEIQAVWRELGFYFLQISIHPQTEFALVVEHLSRFEEALRGRRDPYGFGLETGDAVSQSGKAYTVVDSSSLPSYELADLEERYSNLGSEPNLDAAAQFDNRAIVGRFHEDNLHVFVGYSREFDACVFKLDGETLSAGELYDRAFFTLDDWVGRKGGVEEVVDNIGSMDHLIVRIQADGDTPWQCVGAATFQIQQSGWPLIQFEAMGKLAPAQSTQNLSS